MYGIINSIKTMATNQGPGFRTEVKLDGCSLDCLHCNCKNQSMERIQVNVDQLVDIVKELKPYYGTDGGVTFTGGEPLEQGEFLLETAKRLKDMGISVAIDTSGFGYQGNIEELLKNIDLIILDVKAFDDNGYKKLTGSSMEGFLEFVSSIRDFDGKIWIRHLMVEGLSDTRNGMDQLLKTINEFNIQISRVEIMPCRIEGEEEPSPMATNKAKILEIYINKSMEFQKINS